MEIHCNRCKVLKPHNTDFFKTCKVNGKIYLEKTCKTCRNIGANIAAKKRLENPEYARKREEYSKSYNKKHYAANKEYYKQRSIRLKDHYRNWKREHYNPEKEKLRNERRWKNPTYKVSKLLANRINQQINDKNFDYIVRLLDYSIKDLIHHLEAQFRDGMSWENYGPYWHIDHIKPISHFTFSSRHDKEFKECWALNNLQPLLAKENLSKGNRYVGKPVSAN